MAQEKKTEKYVNETFASILARVTMRDPPSWAILKVAPLPDAPDGEPLDFTIDDGWDLITLSRREGEKTVVYEQYRLKGDEAMQDEWHNQQTWTYWKRLEAKPSEKEAQKIERLSRGKLRFGMLPDEVVKAVGEPHRSHHFQRGPRWSQWVYPEFVAVLVGERLANLLEPEYPAR